MNHGMDGVLPEQAEGQPRLAKNKSRLQAIQEVRAQVFRERARASLAASAVIPPSQPPRLYIYRGDAPFGENSTGTAIGSLTDAESLYPLSVQPSNENSSSSLAMPLPFPHSLSPSRYPFQAPIKPYSNENSSNAGRQVDIEIIPTDPHGGNSYPRNMNTESQAHSRSNSNSESTSRTHSGNVQSHGVRKNTTIVQQSLEQCADV